MSRWSYYLPILGYHRVGRHRADHVPTVSAEAFERQLTLVARGGYRVLSFDEIAGLLDRGERLPRRSLSITFDDGYEETSTVAWPLLKRFGFSAAVFVSPGEVGAPGFATWEQINAMAKDGMIIGSHTMHHSYLPAVNEERLSEELEQSKRIIEERIGRSVRYLSYPIGGFTPRAQAVAKAAGYRIACTTNRALSRAGVDRYALRRVKMTDRDVLPLSFWVKASGYYDLFRQLKQPY